MRRNKLVLMVVALAAVAVTACSNPTAPKPACGTTYGGQICK